MRGGRLPLSQDAGITERLIQKKDPPTSLKRKVKVLRAESPKLSSEPLILNPRNPSILSLRFSKRVDEIHKAEICSLQDALKRFYGGTQASAFRDTQLPQHAHRLHLSDCTHTLLTEAVKP